MPQTPSLEAPGGSPHQYFTRQGSSTSVRKRPRGSSLPGEPRGDTGSGAITTIGDGENGDATQARRTKPEKGRPHSKRQKARTLFARARATAFKHTWLIPLVLIVAILSLYFASPGTQNPLYGWIFLSYPLPPKTPSGPTQYGKGGWDFAFVGFYSIVFSFTREFIMQRLCRPLAIKAGMKTKAKQSRFMEQLYTAIYFMIFGPFGLYVMSRSPVWFFNTTAMYEGFPHRQHEGLFKAYYLLQAAYWTQQAIVLVLQLEKPRKDFKELVAHHVITIALIWLSYRFHFTYMGLAVYITHDISDFFLATSKLLNYCESIITGPYYFMFICWWAYGRHYLNLKILYSILTEFRTVGPFDLNWDTQQYKCWISQYITFALLAALQSVNLFWFFLILRIAVRYVINRTAEDDRSIDSEAEEEVEGSTAEKKALMDLDPTKDLAEQQPAPQVLLNGMPVEESNGVHEQRSGAGGARKRRA